VAVLSKRLSANKWQLTHIHRIKIKRQTENRNIEQ